MKNFLPIFFMAFLAYTLAQSCNNPLLDIYSIARLEAPASGGASIYCKNLQDGHTCCSNATNIDLQRRLDDLTATLQTLAGERDTYIAQLAHNYTSQLRKAESKLNVIIDDYTLKKVFIDMQNKRVVCFTALLEIQAAAYCLACDPDWETNGVFVNGTVNSADAVCKTIQDACSPYTAAMDKFNTLFQADNTPTLTNATERTNSQPAGCDDDSCPWQCSNLFNGSFVMNISVAGNGGGVIGGSDVASPDLEATQVIATGSSGDGIDTSTTATTGTWNPEMSISGILFLVVPDPANVTSSDSEILLHLSGSRIHLMAALIMMLMSAFFLTM